MANEPSTANGGETPESAYIALHAEREVLERDLVLAQQQQRFGEDTVAIEEAHRREAELLKALDQVLTRIRAAEYRRRPGARRW